MRVKTDKFSTVRVSLGEVAATVKSDCLIDSRVEREIAGIVMFW